MNKSVVIALSTCLTLPSSLMAAQHDHDTLFSRDNAVMAAAAVETVNNYCVEFGTLSEEYVSKQSAAMRETIEGLSTEVLGQEFKFTEEDEMYHTGVEMGTKLIRDAELSNHVEQMCTLPQ
ncbi:hypothetical protein [Vibrio owensii]|uniref:hypothetical protein n=1 Tax=Vibrio owensii TaxID=696485 RepID=UPI00221E5651|nr:hypothetical protein [Vibrio owensii]